MLRFDPLGDGISRVEYIDHMGGDAAVVQAARVSFANDEMSPTLIGGMRMSEDELRELERPTEEILELLRQRPELPFDEERDTKLIRYLARNNHWSPFEHVLVKHHIVTPIFVARQWHRHWTWSYNEMSRRYTEEDIQFYKPNDWRGQAASNRQASAGFIGSQAGYIDGIYETFLNQAQHLYEELLNQQVAREMARMVLPQATYTRFYGTVNLRSIMHFCAIRDDPHAQWEIQRFAQDLSQIARMIAPVTMEAYDDFVKGQV